jgi:hypothetical protein
MQTDKKSLEKLLKNSTHYFDKKGEAIASPFLFNIFNKIYPKFKQNKIAILLKKASYFLIIKAKCKPAKKRKCYPQVSE